MMTDSRVPLIKALIKARGEFTPVLKDGKNPHFKSRYATLDSVVEAITPALLNNGLILLQPISQGEDGGMVLITQLWHESGERFEFKFVLPQLADLQKMGSAITYARRYSILSLLGIAPEDDDDGNAAVPMTTQQRPAQTPATAVANRGTNGTNGKPPKPPTPGYDWDSAIPAN